MVEHSWFEYTSVRSRKDYGNFRSKDGFELRDTLTVNRERHLSCQRFVSATAQGHGGDSFLGDGELDATTQMLEGHALGAGTSAGQESLRVERFFHSGLLCRNCSIKDVPVKGRRRVIRIDGIEIAGRVGFVVHLSLEAHPLLGLGLRRGEAGRIPGFGKDGDFVAGVPEHLSIGLTDGPGSVTIAQIGDNGHEVFILVRLGNHRLRRTTSEDCDGKKVDPILFHRSALLEINFVVIGLLQSAGDGVTQAEGCVILQVHHPDRRG